MGLKIIFFKLEKKNFESPRDSVIKTTGQMRCVVNQSCALIVKLKMIILKKKRSIFDGIRAGKLFLHFEMGQ